MEDWSDSLTPEVGHGSCTEMLTTMLNKQDEMKKLIDAMSARMDAFEESSSMKQPSNSSSNSSADSEKKRVSPELSVSTACIFVHALLYDMFCRRMLHPFMKH